MDANNSWSQKLEHDSDELMLQIENLGILSDSIHSVYKEWFHISGHQKLFNTDGCIIQNMAALIGKENTVACHRCTWCIHGKRSIQIEELLSTNPSTPINSQQLSMRSTTTKEFDIASINNTKLMYYQEKEPIVNLHSTKDDQKNDERHIKKEE